MTAKCERLVAYYVTAPPSEREWCHVGACLVGARLLGWRVCEKAFRSVWYNRVSRCAVCRKYINNPNGLIGIPRKARRR